MSKDVALGLLFECMDVTATFTCEKVSFWPFFETTNARFPFQIAATARTRTPDNRGTDLFTSAPLMLAFAVPERLGSAIMVNPRNAGQSTGGI